MKRLAFALLFLVPCCAALAQSEFTPLSWDGQDIFESRPGLWLRPNLGAPGDVLPLKTRMYATQESVTGGVALKFVFEKGAVGQFAVERSAGQYPKGSAGITFYAKASRPLTLAVGARDSKAIASVTTDWQKFDLPWDKLGQFDWQTFFTVRGAINQKTWLIIDRLGTESPAFDKVPTINSKSGPDQAISSRDIIYGRENLKKTADNLTNKKPIKIIAIGDSVTAGAQITRGSPQINKEAAAPYHYFARFAILLQERFGYKEIQAIGKGIGGQRIPQGLARLDKDVLAEAGPDDVVIIEFGANDMGWGGDSAGKWKENLRTMITRVKARTDQIIVMSPTVGGEIPEKAAKITEALEELVKEEKVAAVDITRWSMYRGAPFAWSLLANDYHPDLMGHLWMAEMMAPLFTGKEVTYPE